MNTEQALSLLSPDIMKMIRLDHAHVLTMFHRYRADLSPARKQTIAEAISLALEIHAQLEEEILYPALDGVVGGDAVLDKSRPEHDEMRRLIGQLRQTDPSDPAYDPLVMELQRDVLHHVADEETVLLPAAELKLADQLGALGVAMTRRRLQLSAPHAGRLVAGSVATMPPAMIAMAAGCFAAGLLLASAMRRPQY